jgi:hypothetical protein
LNPASRPLSVFAPGCTVYHLVQGSVLRALCRPYFFLCWWILCIWITSRNAGTGGWTEGGPFGECILMVCFHLWFVVFISRGQFLHFHCLMAQCRLLLSSAVSCIYLSCCVCLLDGVDICSTAMCLSCTVNLRAICVLLNNILII